MVGVVEDRAYGAGRRDMVLNGPPLFSVTVDNSTKVFKIGYFQPRQRVALNRPARMRLGFCLLPSWSLAFASQKPLDHTR